MMRSIPAAPLGVRFDSAQAAARMKLYQWSRDYFKTKLGEAVREAAD